ncbi:helix-turn-helix domain-containing protein [Shewanella oncorhynchi]|uniref:helix-turn-helix domain-containing protein n=1 Tax=Shewanella oncorhynchi TaxID=2726434 RepID=UPI003D7BE096
MSGPIVEEPMEAIVASTIEGFKQAKLAIERIQLDQKSQAKAAYHSLSSAGKARYIVTLVEFEGSQSAVAELLDLSRGRISQQVKADKPKWDMS